MRLDEIINTIDKNISGKMKRVPDTKDGSVKNPEFLGKGAFSYAVNDKNDPHMINKKSNDVAYGAYDGFDFYVKELINANIMGSNPFAPRVYKRSEFNMDKARGKYFKYKMEKLFPLGEITFDEAEGLVRQLEPNKFIELDPDKHKYYPASAIASIVNAIVKGTIGTSNENLDQLARLIRKVEEKNRLILDIHASNVMIRRTPHGPQIVITDPLV